MLPALGIRPLSTLVLDINHVQAALRHVPDMHADCSKIARTQSSQLPHKTLMQHFGAADSYFLRQAPWLY